MDVTKICNKCGRILPIENFRLVKGQFYNPYYLGQCKECEYKYQRRYLDDKRQIQFFDSLDILIKRQYKKIKKERILNISNTDIVPLQDDEIFVKLMDYKDAWLSNYGRAICYAKKKYILVKAEFDSYGVMKYTLRKDTYNHGKWKYKRYTLYVPQAVVNEFIVNPDKVNNIYIWHRGFDKKDCYYKNLYPLNAEQYKAVKRNFNKTGDDSEEFIIKIMNEISYKPDTWSKKSMQPIMCGVGYRGTEDNIDYSSESYLRWHDMINRCYNKVFHERQPQYADCTVCAEWLNYSNFRLWFEQNKPDGKYDLDKDILFKGNTEYSPSTSVFVPHDINTLFVNRKRNRGDLPIGVYLVKDRNKYRACMSYKGKQIKLGTFNTAKEAFNSYKVYKENFIQSIAESYKEEIPNKVYKAMMNYNIEITD